MKKYLLLLIAALALGFTSCADDETIPTLTDLSIVSENEATEVVQDGILTLTAEYSSNVEPQIEWKVNGEVKSTEKEFKFSAVEAGKYYISLTISTEVGEKSTAKLITVYGKYREGTFVLNEGNFGNPPSSLIFISPEEELTEEAYFKVNGTHLGDVCQDLWITNNKMYVISQNGGNDGMLVVANAETLKKETAFSKGELSALSMPTHVAVVNDNQVYIRDGKGVYLLNPSRNSLSFIAGTERAIKNRMAISDNKVFVGGNKSVFVLKDGKVIHTIALESAPTGIIKASDGHIWVSTDGAVAQIAKISSKDYSVLQTNNLTGFNVSAGWGATPGISAKGDMIYFGNAGTTIYSHNFTTSETKELAKVGDYVQNASMAYNNLGVDPKDGNLFVTTIKGYGNDYLTNNISVFNFENKELKTPLVTNFENKTRFPAGVFFTSSFE